MAERLSLHQPFTVREQTVVELVAAGYTYNQIARHLKISPRSVAGHVKTAAGKIPGSLPAKARIIVWYRGAGEDVLV